MQLLRRFRPSPAMAIACLALLVALGGTGYAATRLPRNSVTTVQVKDFSLLARDFKRGQIPRGPAGSGGAGAKWALVRADGGIAAQSGGITLAAKPGAGTYILGIGSSVTGKAILSSGAYAADAGDQRGETTAGPCGGGTEGRTCPASDNANTVFVQTRNNDGIPTDHAFYVAVVG